jgi:hypothetical protein
MSTAARAGSVLFVLMCLGAIAWEGWNLLQQGMTYAYTPAAANVGYLGATRSSNRHPTYTPRFEAITMAGNPVVVKDVSPMGNPSYLLRDQADGFGNELSRRSTVWSQNGDFSRAVIHRGLLPTTVSYFALWIGLLLVGLGKSRSLRGLAFHTPWVDEVWPWVATAMFGTGGALMVLALAGQFIVMKWPLGAEVPLLIATVVTVVAGPLITLAVRREPIAARTDEEAADEGSGD